MKCSARFSQAPANLPDIGAGWLNNPANPFGYSAMGPVVAAALEVFAHAAAPHGKPEFGIETVKIGRQDRPRRRADPARKPFGQLKHFRRDGVERGRGC